MSIIFKQNKSVFYKLNNLNNYLDGEIETGELHLLAYSTDASAYKEKPLAVAYPKNKTDLKKLIQFVKDENLSLIPRATGTSLAGQVVGSGIVVDFTKYFNKILDLNIDEKWVKVQSGVILEELNKFLEKHNLFFGPEASTANRCTIGGMVGNNACGLHSLIYGSTRDHLLEVKAILSDGSDAIFEPLSIREFHEKRNGTTLESNIYKNIFEILGNPNNQKKILEQFPVKSIHRRNTGYAIDLLLDNEIFTDIQQKFNFCKMIAGSEGTLCFVTEIKLNLVSLPPRNKAIVCVHLNSLEDALQANLLAIKHQPVAIELMDRTILNLTRDNIEQRKNRFFVKGEPGAILMVEFADENSDEIKKKAEHLITDFINNNFGYHFPVIWGNDIKKVWNLRKAGLGVLSNVPGDAKPVSVIEDTAVRPDDLPDYIADFKKILQKYNLDCVFHAHIGTGELHFRPILNLKDKKDVKVFRKIARDTALLVKKYKGSLSGEHGDGRLRGEFIQLMIGEHNYNLIKQIKYTWDKDNIFNPGKIIGAPMMDTNLRYTPDKKTKTIDTIFDFSNEMGIVRAVEKCNGSGDCRKSELIGGTMCPSFMATKNELNTTRARANVLREVLNNSTKLNPFNHKEIYNIMDLCLSCKACKSECPSGVDMAKLKAEFLQHYFDSNRIPLRTRLIAYFHLINRILSYFPVISIFIMQSKFFSTFFQLLINFSTKRKIPLPAKTTLNKWNKKYNNNQTKSNKVYLFNDEFTNFTDTEIGIKSILLLTKLGYEVIIPKHFESGRTFLSKGFLRKAKKIANSNVACLKDLINKDTHLVGIEPSAILTFRDEYPELVDARLQNAARKLSKHSFTIEEFIFKEIKTGKINKEQFTKEKLKIKLHGHCQQKSIASTEPVKFVLSFPENYEIEEIPSGCCGMAGSFGYEKEHYEISMKIGELILFPAIRNSDNCVIVAPGTSCRQQIFDGTGKKAFHPIEILYEALL